MEPHSAMKDRRLTADLTPEQRAIVEADDGPVVVIAGAGTGKTRVIVERVRWLLETKGGEPPLAGDAPPTATALPAGGPTADPAAAPTIRHGNPFDGPLVPEQILVLTYNVKAARELQDRLDQAVGPATRARMTVSNFHSFCQHVLTESSADAGLPARPDVLDGVGQLLLLGGLRSGLDLRYHSEYAFPGFVGFINRAKDELAAPDDVDRFVAAECEIYEQRYGSFDEANRRLEAQGNLEPLRKVRPAYASLRANERAEDAGELRAYDARMFVKATDREARRAVAGDGHARGRGQFETEDHPRIDLLAEEYERDGAALEVLRLTEIARVYHAYEEELARRGALDFGEQIALVARLFKTRPNVLRRWQRQFRYILVDEFQDANVAQIELIELLGRTPDRPDNVMVVGDDDQSIYRFRGASYAAFAEFDARFGHPRRLRIDQNFRSFGHVLAAANRLIGRNTTRYEPDKRLWTDKPAGVPVELHVCAGTDDEAVAIVDAIRVLAGPGTGDDPADAGRGSTARWNDVAVLYRKHKHRDAIVERLRAEDIPYTVVGGLSLFEAPEIRDLEQGLRAIVDPHDDPALVRMMTAGPWRLDAIEILRVVRAHEFDRGTHILEIATAQRDADTTAPETRARLRGLLAAISDLNPLTWREGPSTILDRYLERTGVILDLLAAGTLEAKRSVVNIASFMRFALDWQAENPARSLAEFIAYLDAYRAAGGELPTSVELTEDVQGVRLMTLYQAKGLEFPVVIVPNLLDGEWPVREQSFGWFPRELLREAVPAGDLHTDEERRLLYVAMTRARERLLLMTHGDGGANPNPKAKAQSRFVGELRDGAGEEFCVVDRTAGEATGTAVGVDDRGNGQGAGMGEPGAGQVAGEPAIDAALAAARRVMPLPTARERRLAMRLRAAELVGLAEATADTDPEAEAARETYAARLADLARNAALTSDEARAAGLDPLTFRSIALDSGAGANLLAIAPLPPAFSYSSLTTYEACPLRYAFSYVYRIPEPDRPSAPLTFGSTAHSAFEAFTRERRERLARGEAAPTREDLERHFKANWVPEAFGDRTTEEAFGRRVDRLLENFWEGEVSSIGEAIAEEMPFALVLDPADGTPPVRIHGSIDRIDRLPGGGIEVIDYKTGKIGSQSGVDKNLQLTIYALACRDALGLGTPERVTLYFTESATRMSTLRTDEQLDAAREELLARVVPIRAGEFTANPGRPCEWCDYRAMCPERA
jgi:DNA helicase-2/ATP-dependent DNA helicase PcrA